MIDEGCLRLIDTSICPPIRKCLLHFTDHRVLACTKVTQELDHSAGGHGFAAREFTFGDHSIDLGKRILHLLRQRRVQTSIRLGVCYELLTLSADGTYCFVKISGGCQVNFGEVGGLKLTVGFRLLQRNKFLRCRSFVDGCYQLFLLTAKH